MTVTFEVVLPRNGVATVNDCTPGVTSRIAPVKVCTPASAAVNV
ncbi:MAG: hypothetical protein U0835_19105 [Isosphaeraceae bacterium]